MKRFLFLLLLLFSHLLLHSQRFQVQLAIQSGVSVPLSDFSGTRLEKGSFALPGFSGSVETTMVLKDKWTGFVQGGMQLNPIDVGLLGYEKMQADPFLLDVYIRSDPFKVVHILAGPGYQTKIGKSFLIEGQLAGGIFFSATPYQLYKPKYFLTGPPYYEIKTSNDIGFAYGANLRFGYEVTPWYQIGITNQFLHSRAAFDFYTSTGIRTDHRNISLWNISLSFVVKLFSTND
ncbi:MAG: hypothetical protein RBR28_05505 [Lentimicrobium sp.]|jgi:hypothetical protein|nr:hypothetical protein [Lentimicrobium sp.]